MIAIDLQPNEAYDLLRIISIEIKNVEKILDELPNGGGVNRHLRVIYNKRLSTLDSLRSKTLAAARVPA